MNGTEAAFSYTLKTPADNLFTIRGDTYDEFFDNLVAVKNDDEIVNVLGDLQKAVGRASAEGVDQSRARRSSAQPSRSQRNSEPDPFDDDSPTCKHGPMEHKSGTSKAGKPYSGYFCARNDKMCKPVWDN